MSVLVLQSHLRPGPWVVRSLTDAGFRVVSGSTRPFVGASLSGGVAASARLPSPADDLHRFVAAVREAVRRESVDVILPLTETTLAALIVDGDDDIAAMVAGPTPAQYELLSDKGRLPELAAGVGVATLAGVVAGPAAPCAALPAPPVVVKPLASATLQHGAVVYERPVLALTETERDRAVARIAATTGRALVQPFASGARLHVHAWRSRGAAGGLVTRVRRSWPPEIGMASAATVADEPDALVAVSAILDAADYRGVASADMIRLDDGRLALHDVNPRVPFSVAEAIFGGLDTPRIAVQIALGEEPEGCRPGPAGRDYHWASGEIRWLTRRGGGVVARELADALMRRDGTVDPLSARVAVQGVVDLMGTAVARLSRRRPFRGSRR